MENKEILNKKQKAVRDALNEALSDGTDMEKVYDLLWDCVNAYAGYPFCTVKGLTFSYSVKGGEIFIDRKEKSITKATINISLYNAMIVMKENGKVSGPKKLKTFGASYIYPMFIKFGIFSPK